MEVLQTSALPLGYVARRYVRANAWLLYHNPLREAKPKLPVLISFLALCMPILTAELGAGHDREVVIDVAGGSVKQPALEGLMRIVGLEAHAQTTRGGKLQRAPDQRAG